jgi:hypothetical protein
MERKSASGSDEALRHFGESVKHNNSRWPQEARHDFTV